MKEVRGFLQDIHDGWKKHFALNIVCVLNYGENPAYMINYIFSQTQTRDSLLSSIS